MTGKRPLKGFSAFLFHHVIYVQGVYYLLTGLWPLLSISSFIAFTGPKTDIWLVKTAGLMLMVDGAALIVAVYRRQVNPAVVILGAGTALALSVMSLVFVFGGVISAVYLVDTILEIFFVAGWLGRWIAGGRAG